MNNWSFEAGTKANTSVNNMCVKLASYFDKAIKLFWNYKRFFSNQKTGNKCHFKITSKWTMSTRFGRFQAEILKDRILNFGNEWKRINCQHPVAAEIEDFGDMFNCKITMKDGSSIKN
jgi:hypothetical protein